MEIFAYMVINLVKKAINYKTNQYKLYNEGSSSSKTGLQIGDEILEINDENVCNYNDTSKIIKFIHNVS